jgi:hypothetical protein
MASATAGETYTAAEASSSAKATADKLADRPAATKSPPPAAKYCNFLPDLLLSLVYE